MAMSQNHRKKYKTKCPKCKKQAYIIGNKIICQNPKCQYKEVIGG
jgi:hypothetical protein